MDQQLSVVVHEEQGSYWAEVEEFPGAFATGDNLDELRESLEEALSMYLAEEGQKAPRAILEFVPDSPLPGSRQSARLELAGA